MADATGGTTSVTDRIASVAESYEEPRTESPRSRTATAALCKGQSGIERRVLETLVEYARDVAPLDGCLLGLRAASAGPACLHLDTEPSLLGYLVHRLCPAVVGADERLVGVPGLRLAHSRPGRLELRRRDGHGRLVLHLDAVGERALGDWDRDRAAVYRGGRSVPGAPAPSSCRELRSLAGLHPSEREALRRSADTAADATVDAERSRELRRLVHDLPVLPDAHACSDTLRIERKLS